MKHFAYKLLSFLFIFSLLTTLLPGVPVNAEGAVERNFSSSYEPIKQIATKTYGFYDFTAYESNITLKESTATGKVVVVSVNESLLTEGQELTMNTADILPNLSLFWNELCPEEQLDGLILNAGEERDVIISEPLLYEYVEIQAQYVYYGNVTADETEQNQEASLHYTVYESTELPALNDVTRCVYINALEVIMQNERNSKDSSGAEIIWTADCVDIRARRTTLYNTPIYCKELNCYGIEYFSNADLVNCYVQNIFVGLLSLPENYTDEFIDKNYEGTLITEEYFHVSQNGVPVTVTFDFNDKVTEPLVFDTYYGAVFTDFETYPVAPTRKGYSFNGWFGALSGGKQVGTDETNNTIISGEDITYYAHWVPNEYKVTVIEDESDPENTTTSYTAAYDSLCSFLPNIEKEGYVLRGFTDKAGIELLKKSDLYTYTTDLVLYPVWREENCSHNDTKIINCMDVTCAEDGYSGDVFCNICEETIKYGDIIEKTGHVETELKNMVDSTCQASGYSGDSVCTECGEVAVYGEDTPKTSHEWIDGKIVQVATNTSNGKISYTCKYCGVNRTTTYKKSIEVEDTPAEDEKPSDVPSVPPTENLPEDDKSSTEEQKQYTITYVLKGGVNHYENPTSYTQKTSTFSLKSPSRKGYMFKGWYTDKKMKHRVYNIKIGSTGNKTFYAKWSKVKSSKVKSLKVENRKHKKVRVTFKAASGAYGYQIQYSTNKKFKKNTKSVIVKKNSYTIKKLKKGKSYYVRVRSFKKDSAKLNVYSKWSSVKKIKISK